MLAMGDRGENLVERILSDAGAAGWGERVALREGSATLTFDALALRVAKTAGALSELGLKQGERVAIYSPDCVDSAVAILAVIYAGAIALPVSELSAANDLRNRLNNSEASVVLSDPSLRTTLDEIRGEVASIRSVLNLGATGKLDRRTAAAEPMDPAAVDSSEPAILLYSAGASNEMSEEGLRGVLHNHGTPIRAFESFAKDFLGLTQDDRVFSTVRLSTAYGLGSGLLFPLLAGAQALLLPEQAHSGRVFDAIVDFKPTVFAATPSLYGQLANDAANAGHTKILSELRWCIAGAEDMPLKIIAMVRGVLGNNVTVGYGLTEAFQFVMAGVAQGRRPGNCGKILSGVEVRIVDDNGAVVGVDEIGSLQLRSSALVARYWGSDAELVEDGWFTTLDRFMVDADQNYYHCGRADHLFKVGGKWVAPAEVEQALLANEAVWECAVIGADDQDGLIKPLAFIVPNIGQIPGAELEAQLREYVKKELAPYKYPRWIEFVDELPKGPSGVILRYKLRDRLLQSRDRRPVEKPRK